MAEKKSHAKVRPLDAKLHQVEVLGEMTSLLQRVRGNKSKRTTSNLVTTGPLRINVIALDEGGELADHKVEGPFTIQCLLGRVRVLVEGDQRMTTGDLLVADAAITHTIRVEEASVLFITIAPRED